MDESEALTDAWYAAARALPPGWDLDGLRCASSGLEPEERSSDWIAVARGPGGVQREHRASDAVTALRGLVEDFSEA